MVNATTKISYVMKEVQLLNYVNLILESAFQLTSKTKPVTLAVVCVVYVHHCKCATFNEQI